jgi:hypothetical protein
MPELVAFFAILFIVGACGAAILLIDPTWCQFGIHDWTVDRFNATFDRCAVCGKRRKM